MSKIDEFIEEWCVFVEGELPRLKAELLELLEQAVPEKRPVDKTSQQTDITAAHIGYNQAIDDYLANIHKLFKGEE